jgi:drug/metabolite transporter (DMT)-like permease
VGIALALHFAFWIASLRFTSVAVSVLLVNTAPAIVAALSYLLWGERLTYRGAMGIFLSICGIVILVGQDLYRIDSWKGALLALLGAVMFAVYLLIGRSSRQSTSLLGYVYPTYVTATTILLILVFAGNAPLQGFSSRTHFFMILLGVLPQCLGHTSYNWALRYLSATVISMLMLAEPVLATLFAWWILGEEVTLLVAVGAAFVATGIFTVSKWGIQTPIAADKSEARPVPVPR